MKKRSQTTNQQTFKQSKSFHETSKKKHSSKETPSKTKNNKQAGEKVSKNYKTNKKEDEPIDDYVMINGDIYKANTNTERMDVHCFVNKFKKETINEKNVKNREKIDNNMGYRIISEEERVEQEPITSLEVEQIVKNLPTEQKMCLMRQLEKELGNNPEFIEISKESETEKEIETEDNSIEKYNILNIKLNTLEQQLENKRENQIDKINKIFYDGGLTASERKNKITIIDKNKNQKLKIINCTRNLFYTLLYNKCEPDLFNNPTLDEAMKELDSFSDGDHNAKSERSLQGKAKKEDPIEENSLQSEFEFDNKVGLTNQLRIKTEDVIETSDKKQLNRDSLQLSPGEKNEKENENERFECQEENLTKKFKIPLLLTKEKLEELEWEKKAKSLQKMKLEIDRKIAFQSSEIEIEELPKHFTTLGDINIFIMGLYEYVMKTDLDQVVEHLNFPYGKPISDKLFLLQQNGEIDDTEYYPVLSETQLNDFIAEVSLNERRFTEEEKIHHKAVFDCFNTHLNAYRPYYDLEGDVYPWSVSEKGITFYEINEENIEEVFEKTKIKVLEYCSLLCGIQPLEIEGNEGYEILKEKNDEQAKKEEKQNLIEEFAKWSIKLTDYDAMVRLLISQEIILSEMANFAKEFSIICSLNK